MSSGSGVLVVAEVQHGPGRNADLPKRVVVGVILASVAGVCVWLGGVAFALLVFALALIIVREWVRMTQVKGAWALPCLAVLLSISAWTAYERLEVIATAVILVPGVALCAASLVGQNRHWGWSGLGLLYAGLAAVSLIWLHNQPQGALIVTWVFVVVWATDVGAYFAGRAIGGPKLAPAISPKKTWAGLVGGMIVAAIAGGVVARFIGGDAWPVAIWLAAFGAVIAQVGDLGESWLKRRFDVKDSGGIFPGHGGAMDRVDGLVALAPLVALALILRSVA